MTNFLKASNDGFNIQAHYSGIKIHFEAGCNQFCEFFHLAGQVVRNAVIEEK